MYGFIPTNALKRGNHVENENYTKNPPYFGGGAR